MLLCRLLLIIPHNRKNIEGDIHPIKSERDVLLFQKDIPYAYTKSLGKHNNSIYFVDALAYPPADCTRVNINKSGKPLLCVTLFLDFAFEVTPDLFRIELLPTKLCHNDTSFLFL